MRKIKMVYLLVFLAVVLAGGTAQARMDFYINDTIQDGNFLDNVYTWNNAVVDMTGGQIDSLDTFNFSVVNLDGGNVIEGVYVWNESTLNMSGGSIGWSLEVTDSGTASLYGGLITDYLYATDSSVIDIYGYGFDYDPNAGNWNGGQLTGFWLDDTVLSIDFLDNIDVDSTYYDHVNLIPEPATLLLLGFGVPMLSELRRKR